MSGQKPLDLWISFMSVQWSCLLDWVAMRLKVIMTEDRSSEMAAAQAMLCLQRKGEGIGNRGLIIIPAFLANLANPGLQTWLPKVVGWDQIGEKKGMREAC